jgi:hypothetical protein
MDTISSDEDDEGKESPKSEEEVQLMRARSIDYGSRKGHARHISAGSAKMFDVRRGSAQFATTPPLSPALRSSNALAGQETSTKEEE